MKEQLNAEELLNLIAVNASVAWDNATTESDSPNQVRYFQRMSNPVIGDLVLEISTPSARNADKIGRLISKKSEMRPVQNIVIWTIETLDGRSIKWTNSSFIVIPEEALSHQGKDHER